MKEWRDIPGFEGLYKVSSEGEVFSIRNDRLLKPWKHPRGYLAFNLGQTKKFTAHTLVMLAFVGPPPPEMEVCHNNSIKTDNRLENLRYDTKSGNRKDIVYQRGENHSQSVVSESTVLKIVEMGRSVNPSKISKALSVSRGVVNQVLRGETWGWLTGIEKQKFTNNFSIKINEADREKIFELVSSGKVSRSDAALKYGVHYETISRIIRQKQKAPKI